MMSGVIREIRRIYPEAHITLVIFPRALPLVEFCPYVDEIIANSRNCDWYQIESFYQWDIEIAKQLLNRRFDICFAFPHYSETAFLMYMSGAKTRITYNFPDDKKDFIPLYGNVPINYSVRFATHIVPRYEFGTHVADIHFALIDYALHVPVLNRDLEIWLTPLDCSLAQNTLKNFKRPIYALCMGGTGGAKRYPAEKYAELLNMILAKDTNATFIILGGGEIDAKSAETLKNNILPNYAKRIIDFTNKINYRQSGAFLKFCDMYIGNDTGTMHMAAALKCPVLMPKCFPADLTRNVNDSPRLWYPYKVPNVIILPEHALPECKINEPYTHHGCRLNVAHCITQIKPATLYKGFKTLKKRIAENDIKPVYLY